MRILATADIHYNHPRSRRLADELIERVNRTPADVLLLVGDTAASGEDALERCLERFCFDGPKLFVPGNHELWTLGEDSHALLREELPRRVRNRGWHWLPGDPYLAGSAAIVGSLGWYDYSFATGQLQLPRRFYEAKVAPGTAGVHAHLAHLLEREDDIPPGARNLVARWNDGRFVKLGRSDEQFLGEILAQLAADLRRVADVPHILAAVHHVPFGQLLPPPGQGIWAFARAYLGSDRIGRMLLEWSNVKQVLCGHSHFPAAARIGHIDAVNIGSGYRLKRWEMVEVPGPGE